MRELLFPVRHHGEVSLQTQLRRHLVDAILDRRLRPDNPLPSCRRLAHALGVSRNTVVLAYQALADEGFLISRERVGYFVNAEMPGGAVPAEHAPEFAADGRDPPHSRNGRPLREYLIQNGPASIQFAFPVSASMVGWPVAGSKAFTVRR